MPGRNLAVILEAAAINNRQKKMGYNAARELLAQPGAGRRIDPSAALRLHYMNLTRTEKTNSFMEYHCRPSYAYNGIEPCVQYRHGDGAARL